MEMQAIGARKYRYRLKARYMKARRDEAHHEFRSALMIPYELSFVLRNTGLGLLRQTLDTR